MTLDRNAVNQLLALNDKQLAIVIKKLAAEAGIDTAAIQINAANISAIRAALSMATDEDLKGLTEKLASMQKGGQHHA